MRRCLKTVCSGFLFFVLLGCVPSIHSLFTEKDLIFESALVGEWASQNAKETWTLTKSGEKEYKLVYADEKGGKGEFVVHLLKVEGRLFLDLFPVEPDLKENAFYRIHLLPMHTFMRVRQITPTLQVQVLSPDWIKKYLQENPGAIRYEKVDDNIVLTAQPKELQAFLVKHEKTADAWIESGNMT